MNNMKLVVFLTFFQFCLCLEVSNNTLIQNVTTALSSNSIPNEINSEVPCVCGVFLSGQFVKGSSKGPEGNPALLHEYDGTCPCGTAGMKFCTSKCLEMIIRHLPNSAAILCGAIDRDCYKERAYLFVRNCNSTWINTNLAAGREYCCKNGSPYKCPTFS